MNLHESKQDFKDIIDAAGMITGIVPSIIEKDYYVSLFLKELIKSNPNIIFKGGTSLSKCYGVIDRFSEDIDLNVMTDAKRISVGTRKELSHLIQHTIAVLGMELHNPGKIYSGRDYNRYEIAYDSLYPDEHLKSYLLIETATWIKSYPIKVLKVDSIIGKYLCDIKRLDIVNRFCLQPFTMRVQSLDRTFLDKIFALVDYYLQKDFSGRSRHLYDLFKLQEHVNLDAKLKKLYNDVLLERRPHKKCDSAQENVDLVKSLQEIYDHDIYKSDYKDKTLYLLHEECSYDQAVEVLPVIIAWLKK